MTTTPPAMPPAMGPMEELLLDVAGGEGASTPGLVRSVTGTATGGKPSICTTTLTDVTFAPTPEDAIHHTLTAEMPHDEVSVMAAAALQCSLLSTVSLLSFGRKSIFDRARP